MFSLATLASLLVAICAQLAPSDCLNLSAEWQAYKLQHGKTYENTQIDALRMEIYTQTKQRVEQFNRNEAAEAGYTKGLNHMSDWSHSEKMRLNGVKMPESMPQNTPDAQKFLDDILNDNSVPVPDEVDWRKVPNRVSHVKDQGKCGSCWIFSAIGTLEGQEASRGKMSGNKTLVSLSEQMVLDCGHPYGCWGGFPSDVFGFIKRQGGIDDDTYYPFVGSEGECKFNKSKVVITDKSFATISSNGHRDEENMKQVVAKFGPISVAVDANDFNDYKSGIISKCSNNVNHAILVVGYGKDKATGKDYWLFKNSWSTVWGEEGYGKILRGNNTCGIAERVVIPTF